MHGLQTGESYFSEEVHWKSILERAEKDKKKNIIHVISRIKKVTN